MLKYAGEINVQGTTITLVECVDALDAWLTEEDVKLLRSWLKEVEPLTFTMVGSDNLIDVKLNPFCTDTKDGRIFHLESKGMVEDVLRATDLRLVIPALLYKRPNRNGTNQQVNVAVTNTMSIPYNEVSHLVNNGGQMITRLDRLDIDMGEEMRPFALSGLHISDSVDLFCFDQNLFVISEQEETDIIITIEQPQHNDYLQTITYELNSSFDDTLITCLLGLGLPYTRFDRKNGIQEFYLRVEDYFAEHIESQFS